MTTGTDATPGAATRAVVAVAQVAAGQDWRTNLDAVTSVVAAAAADPSRPDVVVLPEAIMTDFAPGDPEFANRAQPLDGGFASGLRALAARHGTALVAGMFERSDDPARPYNTLLVVGADGNDLGHYRKMHLYDAYGFAESDQLRRGDVNPLVVEIAGLRLGVMTCYDLRFPETARLLVDAGAEVLVVPAAWVRGALKERHWQTLLAARAIENTCFVAAACQNGSSYCGNSTILDPQGVTLASLGEQTGYVVATADPDRLAECRRINPSLRNRRFRVAPDDTAPEAVTAR